MEENSEPHMETDVSSTTGDVPETQEVTGSDGNVEMIVIVEKLDDEPSADEETVEQLSPNYEFANNPTTSGNKSPQRETQVPKSPAKLPVKSPPKSPAKSPAKALIKSPTKPSNIETEVTPDAQSELEVEHMVVIVQQQDELTPADKSQLIEDADSSMEPVPIQSEDQSIQMQNSPMEEAQKPDQTSASIDLQPQEDPPTKDSKQGLLDSIVVNGLVQSNDTSKIDDMTPKTVIDTIDIIIDTSNDSQTEIVSDVSEKEPKSISRELKSLIKSAKESKIISECNQLTSKTRKSRSGLDTSTSSLNSSLGEPSKINNTRRMSDMSQKSNCSEKSDKVVLKRSMRSQNPEFVSKVKQFLNSVTGRANKDSDDDEDEGAKTDLLDPMPKRTPPKRRKSEAAVTEKSNKLRSDAYCWRCHWAVEENEMHPPMQCTVCPRSFHYKCLTGSERNKINLEKNWVCPECMVVLQAESSESRSPAMKKISLGMLCDLLKYALERMMDLNGVEPFMQPVDRTAFPDYDKYVVHPMDLSLMKANIDEGLYGSTEAFLADAQWILHNSIIFNTFTHEIGSAVQSKLTAGARALVRSCRAEMGEVEACPECYAAAHAHRPTWFTDVCTTPHVLFWAKLKGFPYWPAKGMSVNSAGLVDVRFFGAHDRAWVPAKDCFLYSEKDPNNFRTKRQDILDSMQEAEHHIRNISRKYGKFVYPPFKTQFDPTKMYEQLKMMIPSFEGEVRSLVKKPPAPKPKSRSNSYKSKDQSFNDGDASDNEDTTVARKMADGAEIVKMEDDDDKSVGNSEKDTGADTSVIVKNKKEDSESSKLTSSSRKRRRSAAVLEEATITIIESSGGSSSSSSCTSEKRTKHNDNDEEDKTSEENEQSSSKTDENVTEDATEVTPPQTNVTPPRAEDTDLSSTEKDKLRVTPIRIALVTKEKRKTRNSSSSKDTTAKIITPIRDKDKEKEKPMPLRRKSTRSEKEEKTPSTKNENVEKPRPKTPAPKSDKVEKPSTSKSEKVEKTPNSKVDKVEKTPNDKSSKEDRSRIEKRRNSRSSRSINNTSSTRSSDRAEKKSDKTSEGSKTKRRGSSPSAKEKDKDSDADKSITDKSTPEFGLTISPRSVKDRLQFDDDTTLADLARGTGKPTVSSSNNFPTITSVRSLSTIAQLTGVTITKTTTNANTIDITEDNSSVSDDSLLTPTSEQNVTIENAVSTVPAVRTNPGPVVGSIGVCTFARMTSPDRQNTNDQIEVEIKAEPIELDDADTHMEKMDLMTAFRLRPVNPQMMPNPSNMPNSSKNLRDVRINKVVVTPLNARKAALPAATATKTPEIRPRAKKTFPQPKKPEEGRSELNSKNSMVYIPIQPPMTQAPLRLPRPQCNALPTVTTVLRTPIASVANNLVNTVTTPLMQPSSSATSTTSTVTTSTSVATVPAVPHVHTVPLMTSVNGQWMFSFQPVMSVGALDNTVSPPMMNGIAERGNPAALQAPGTALTALQSSGPALAALQAPGPSLTNIVSALPVVSAPGPAPMSAPLSVSAAVPVAGLSPTVTPLNIRVTDNIGEPPRLQPRPLLHPLDPNTAIGNVPASSTAGPVTAKLNQNAVKLTDFFRTLLEDSIEKLDEPWTQLTALKLQLEQENWRHQQEVKEMKHNHELTLAEMRSLFDKEKQRAVGEARRAAQIDLDTAVKYAKSKLWCINCSQEATLYCCWNTSYCDTPCQRTHWAQHSKTCQQRAQNVSNGMPLAMSPDNRLQPPDLMPVLQKNTSSPTLTVGGKVAPSRPFNQDPNNPQKTSIIVSMVEDTSGNQTMKCVGTYKPTTPTQMQPIIINKQLLNNEDPSNPKKVVSSSGGYLIVGAPNNTSVVTPARRTHTIQYYT